MTRSKTRSKCNAVLSGVDDTELKTYLLILKTNVLSKIGNFLVFPVGGRNFVPSCDLTRDNKAALD
jgi:hypothetical protein